MANLPNNYPHDEDCECEECYELPPGGGIVYGFVLASLFWIDIYLYFIRG